VLRSFYRRLRANGKPAKVALVAAMHKLLLILNAMIQNENCLENAMSRHLRQRVVHKSTGGISKNPIACGPSGQPAP